MVVVCPGAWLGRLYDLPVFAQIEQVCFFRGAPDTRPSLVDHGGEDGRFWYGLVSPGVGYKAAQDGARKGPFDPDQPDRPVLRRAGRRAAPARGRGVPRARSASRCTRRPASTR